MIDLGLPSDHSEEDDTGNSRDSVSEQLDDMPRGRALVLHEHSDEDDAARNDQHHHRHGDLEDEEIDTPRPRVPGRFRRNLCLTTPHRSELEKTHDCDPDEADALDEIHSVESTLGSSSSTSVAGLKVPDG